MYIFHLQSLEQELNDTALKMFSWGFGTQYIRRGSNCNFICVAGVRYFTYSFLIFLNSRLSRSVGIRGSGTAFQIVIMDKEC